MNQEHVDVVLRGAEAVRNWRKKNPGVQMDLSHAYLRGVDMIPGNKGQANLAAADLSGSNLIRAKLLEADLRGADLSESNLGDADLTGADLSGADLHGALLCGANLYLANLARANLSGANLTEADLRDVELAGADLRHADLPRANLTRGFLSGADLRGAKIGETVLDEGIANALGLDQVEHRSYSFYAPILLTKPGVPEVFLRGIGVQQPVIDLLPILRGDPIYRHSCFISYSSKDNTFADRLYADLRSRNVPVWKDSHDLPTGAWTRPAVFEQIQLRDKTVLILSASSMASDWVASEVEKALAKERQNPGTAVLFPVRIDDAIKTSTVAWADDLWNRRNITDFTKWKRPKAYAAALDKVLKDLVKPGGPSTEE